MMQILNDANGKTSAKRVWATILLSNAVAMAWYGLLTATDVTMLALQMLGSGVALLGVSVAERRK
jgi:hypothetical protein